MAVAEVDPSVAVRVTLVLVDTVAGLKVKVPVLDPAAIVTEADRGTAVVFELFSVIVTPDGPAGPDKVIVPVTTVVPLPVSDVVESVRLARVGAVTDKATVLATPLVAVKVTAVVAFTA